MDDICNSFLDLVTHCAVKMSLATNHGKKVYNSNLGFVEIPDPCEYQKMVSKLLDLNQTPNFQDSGSVHKDDVYDVFYNGNIRERCFQLLSLISKDNKNHVLKWLLFLNLDSVPNFVNVEALHDFKCEVLTDQYSNVTIDGQISLWKKKKFVVPKKRTRIKRNHSGAKEDFCLLVDHVVPSLSRRELKLVQGHLLCNDTKLPWITGKMQWVLPKSKRKVFDEHGNLHHTVSGLSGHTEKLILYLSFFTSFDIEIVALVCILWLVPCQHHSCWEILCTANYHGLQYDTKKNPFQFCHDILNRLDCCLECE